MAMTELPTSHPLNMLFIYKYETAFFQLLKETKYLTIKLCEFLKKMASQDHNINILIYYITKISPLK